MKLKRLWLVGAAIAILCAAAPASMDGLPLEPRVGTATVLRMDTLTVTISGTIKSQYPSSIQIRKTGPGNQPMVIRVYSAHTGSQSFPIGVGTYLITLTANRHTYSKSVDIVSPNTTIAFSVAP